MRSITLLNLSDFHFNSSEIKIDQSISQESILDFLIKKVTDLYSHSPGWRPDFVVISGDIASSGSGDDYKLAELFFPKLLKGIGFLKTKDRKRVIVIPGNHDRAILPAGISNTDLYKKKLENFMISKKIDNIDHKNYLDDIFNNRIDTNEKFLAFLKLHFDEFNSFCKGMNFSQPQTQYRKEKDGIFTHGVHTFKEFGISFFAINTALVSLFGEVDYGKLRLSNSSIAYSISILKKLKNINSNHLVISMMHHPWTWLTAMSNYSMPNQKAVFDNILEISNLVLCGHTHYNKYGRPDILNFETPFVMCGSAFSRPPDNFSAHWNSFNLIKFDLDNYKFFTRSFMYDDRNSANENPWGEQTLGKFNEWPINYGSKFLSDLNKIHDLKEENNKLINENRYLLAQISKKKKL